MVEQNTSSMAEQVYDLIALPWLGRQQHEYQHQLQLQRQEAEEFNFGWPDEEVYNCAILVAVKPEDICQPFVYVHRAELEELVPEMHIMLDQQVSQDNPPVFLEDRKRDFKVNSTSDNILANVVEEVRLFALLDQGTVLNDCIAKEYACTFKLLLPRIVWQAHRLHPALGGVAHHLPCPEVVQSQPPGHHDQHLHLASQQEEQVPRPDAPLRFEDEGQQLLPRVSA